MAKNTDIDIQSDIEDDIDFDYRESSSCIFEEWEYIKMSYITYKGLSSKEMSDRCGSITKKTLYDIMRYLKEDRA